MLLGGIMALEVVRLCKLSTPALGVASSETEDRVLVTTCAGGIAEHSAATQERRASWRLEAADRDLQCTAVCTSARTVATAVRTPEGSSQILAWRPAEGSAARALERIPVDRAVHSLHPVRGQDSDAALPGEGSAEAFVVFMDGSVSLLSLCRGQEAAVSPSAAAGRLTVAGAGSCRDRLAILTSQGAKEAMLTVYIAEASSLRREDSLAISPPSRAALAGLANRENKVALLWDDGSVDLYSRQWNGSHTLKFRRRLSGFTGGSRDSSLNAVNGTAGPKAKRRKSTGLGDGALQPDCALGFTPKGSMACLCWTRENSDGNGQDEAKRLRLTLVDSEYGTVQMNEYISPDDIGAYKQGAVVQAVPLFTGGIAVLAADHLIAIKFEDAVPTLASVAGSFSASSRSKQALMGQAALHPREWAALQQPLQPMVLATWAQGLGSKQSRDNLDPSEIARPVEPGPDAGEAAQQIQEERKELSRIQARIRDAASHDSEPAAAKLVDSFLALSRSMKTSELGTCMPEQLVVQMMLAMAEQGFWELYDKVVEEQPPASVAAAPGLLLLLLQKSQHLRLSRLLQQIRACSVDDLREPIRHIACNKASPADLDWHAQLREAANEAADLAAADLSSENLIQDAADAASLVHCFDARAVLLHPFVAAAANKMVLMQLMRGLSPTAATWLFRYLQRWLINISELGTSIAGRQYSNGAVLPALGRIVEWLAALIDTHLLTISMSPASVKLAAKTQALTEELLIGQHRLPMMLGALQNLRNKAALPSCGASEAQYSIELMDITIT